MDTSGPSTASTIPPNARITVSAAAAHDSPATVGHRAGRTFTGTSTATYLRWCLTVPLSRDICPGRPGIYRPWPGGSGGRPSQGGSGGTGPPEEEEQQSAGPGA